MNVTILDDNGQTLISLAGSDSNIKPDAKWMQERLWFGYTAGFRELAMKKLAAVIVEHCLFGAGGSGAGTHPDADTERRGAQSAYRRPPFALARMYERRIFIPAENDAQRLEEHEQFNRKIVASAPVGICIYVRSTAPIS